MQSLLIQSVLMSKPLEEVLTMEANNVINNEPLLKDNTEVSKEALFNAKVVKMKESLRKNREAMENIRQKAKQRGLSTEEMLELDAKWIIEQNK